MAENQQAVVIACAVLREVVRTGIEIPFIFMDYGLHLTPRKMRAAIQEQIDALAAPHLVLIGFGLCGNGLIGLQARHHTLIIPRVDDCVSFFLGSRAAYLREFHAEPATYYITPGWLECGGEPMSEHQKHCDKYGPAKAALISDALYGRYRKVCFVAFSPQDLERYRPRAMRVAEFCRERWRWQYTERVGSDALIRRLLEFGRAAVPAGDLCVTEDFVIIKPGEEVRQEQFLMNETALTEKSGSCTTCTIK
ncbi:MAG: DUF1638 domain-containing protein [Acidobacteriia bacterium]|nr:DUF1638 domain-containing protein [Terriglobia bacterium]